MLKIGHLDHVPVHPVIGMEDPWRYRNKVSIPVGEKDGELITGFYQQRSHRIIEDMETCVVQYELTDRTVEAVKRFASNLDILAYDEKKYRGVLRHLMVRTGPSTTEMMIFADTHLQQRHHQ